MKYEIDRISLLYKNNDIEEAERLSLSLIATEKDFFNLMKIARANADNSKINIAYAAIRKIIEKNKNTLNLSEVANFLLEINDFSYALNIYNKISKNKEIPITVLINKSLALLGLKKYVEALEILERILKINHQISQVYINKGLIFHELKLYHYAIEAYGNAILINKKEENSFFNMGNSYNALNDYENAKNCYIEAININPNLSSAYNNLGIILQKQGKYNEAIKIFDKAIAINPLLAYQGLNNKANCYRESGFHFDAIKLFKESIILKSDFAEGFSNLSSSYIDIGDISNGLLYANKALEINSKLTRALNNRALIYKKQGKFNEAIFEYKKALDIDPYYADIYCNLGLTYSEIGMNQESRICHTKALTLIPDNLPYLIERTMCELPVVFSSEEESNNCIEKFEHQLHILAYAIEKNLNIKSYEIIGKNQPYYIAYLNNNNKKILIKYGYICEKIMADWLQRFKSKEEYKNKNNLEKIKIGIISSHIRYHSIWNAFLKGIVTKINKSKFEINIYYLEGIEDQETLIAKNNSKKFVTGPKLLGDWYQTIIKDDLDIALFPEIGMNQKTLQLAALRLAKFQCTSWGHPETSGLPTIDYYLSSELTEDENSQNNYSEKIIQLSNIGCFFEPPSLSIEYIDFQKYGLIDNSTIFLCLGVPNKFHPDNDWIYIEIAKKIINCQFIFMKEEKGAYKILQKRLIKKFEFNNIDHKKKLLFFPYLSRNDFNSLMQKGSLLLDTIYFSHFNTSIQALGNGTPVVTKYGNYMRSRATSAMLKMMGLDELIAYSDNEYIEITIKLATDESFYNNIKNKIKKNINKLYADIKPIQDLENFFLSLVKN